MSSLLISRSLFTAPIPPHPPPHFLPTSPTSEVCLSKNSPLRQVISPVLEESERWVKPPGDEGGGGGVWIGKRRGCIQSKFTIRSIAKLCQRRLLLSPRTMLLFRHICRSCPSPNKVVDSPTNEPLHKQCYRYRCWQVRALPVFFDALLTSEVTSCSPITPRVPLHLPYCRISFLYMHIPRRFMLKQFSHIYRSLVGISYCKWTLYYS